MDMCADLVESETEVPSFRTSPGRPWALVRPGGRQCPATERTSCAPFWRPERFRLDQKGESVANTSFWESAASVWPTGGRGPIALVCSLWYHAQKRAGQEEGDSSPSSCPALFFDVSQDVQRSMHKTWCSSSHVTTLASVHSSFLPAPSTYALPTVPMKDEESRIQP